MIDKKQLFLYEYLKLCNQYFKERNKSLLSEINDMYRRDLNTQNFIFNALPKETRCYSGRVNTESAEDISIMEEGNTFKFSNLPEAKVRVWCKDKDKLKKFIEHKLFANEGNRAILVTELINRKNILFDYDNYNMMIQTGRLQECFTGTLKESSKEFESIDVDGTVKEVLVCSSINKGEVLEVINRFDGLDTKKMVDDIKKSLRY
jgi:hypothetical protein